MVAAETMEGINGNTSYRLPHDATIEVMKKYNRYQPKVVIDNESQETYVGKYEFRPERYATVSREGEKLFIQFPNSHKAEITPINHHTFNVFDFGIRLNFNQSKNELTIIANGETKAKKVE
jgi:hypothetical protein